MRYIQKMPFILSTLAAVIIGGISLNYDTSHQVTYIRMAFGMVAFFILGTYIRNTVEEVKYDMEKKTKELELQKELEEQEELEETKRQEAAKIELEKQNKVSGSKIDYTVDDYGEDFSPLTVSEVLTSKSQTNA